MSVQVKLTNGIFAITGDGLGGTGSGKDIYQYNANELFAGDPSLTLFSASLSFTDLNTMTKFSPLSMDRIFKDCNSLTYCLTDIERTQTAKYAFENCSELVLFQPITGLGSLKDATGMFKNCKVLSSWISVPIPALEIADYMFEGCDRFNDFWYETDHAGIKVEFATFDSSGRCSHALTSAKGMFKNTPGMLKFNARIGGFTNDDSSGQFFRGPADITEMFYGSGVHHFDTSLHCATVADKAFMNASHLKTWNSSLSIAEGMNIYGFPMCTSAVSCFENCTELEELIQPEFTQVPGMGEPWYSLVNGNRMFANSGLKRLVNETAPTVKFTSLRKGVDMFAGCQLDKASVLALAAGMPDIQGQASDGDNTWGIITISIDDSLSEDSDVQSAIGSIQQKGWTVKCPQLNL